VRSRLFAPGRRMVGPQLEADTLLIKCRYRQGNLPLISRKSALKRFLLGPKMNVSSLGGRRLPATPFRMPPGSRIAAATAGERGIVATFWLILRSFELAVLLASIKFDLTNRTPVSQP